LGRPLDSDSIKKVIDELRVRARALRWPELPETTELPDKSLARILKEYLKRWGLVEKTKNGKWMWHERVKKPKSRGEYEALLKHSRELIPGIRALIYEVEFAPIRVSSGMTREKFIEDTCGVKLDPGVVDKLKAYVIEHLRVCSEVLYDKIGELRRLEKSLGDEDRSVKKEIVEELREPTQIPIHISSMSTFKYYEVSVEGLTFSVKKYRYVEHIVHRLVNHMKTPSLIKLEFKYDKKNKSFSWGDIELARGFSEEKCKEIEKVLEKILTEKRFIEKANKLKQYEKRVHKLRSEIADELRGLEASIRVGDILEGTCKVCRTMNLSEE